MEIPIFLLIIILSTCSAFGPFDGNKDVLCNEGTKFACYCSTVTWRKFDRTDAPLCSQLFPGFQAAILELASCDVRLDDNPFAHSTGNREDPDNALTFERYFKRTLATLIRRKCQREPNEDGCSKIPLDLNEEHIVFTAYQCSKDLLTSRLWLVVLGTGDDDEEPVKPQKQQHFVDGPSLVNILTSPSVLPELNPHLFARRSRIIGVTHQKMEGDIGQGLGSIQDQQSQLDEEVSTELGKDEMESGLGDNATSMASVDPVRHNWVAILVAILLVVYFVGVWLVSVVFCIRKRREIVERNRRHKAGLDENANANRNEKSHATDARLDPTATKKLIPHEDELPSEYDNL